MAEGLLRAVAADRFDVGSAGVSPAGFVHELAIEVMGEIGIDIAGHESKGLTEALAGETTRAPVLIILCELAAERLECLPGAVRKLHWHVDDPIIAQGSREERLVVFRRIRDALRRRLGEVLVRGELEACAPEGKHAER
jgi:arsenate reductase